MQATLGRRGFGASAVLEKCAGWEQLLLYSASVDIGRFAKSKNCAANVVRPIKEKPVKR